MLADPAAHRFNINSKSSCQIIWAIEFLCGHLLMILAFLILWKFYYAMICIACMPIPMNPICWKCNYFGRFFNCRFEWYELSLSHIIMPSIRLSEDIRRPKPGIPVSAG
jgi:hypothetical protein